MRDTKAASQIEKAYMKACAWTVWSSDPCIFAEKIPHCFHLNICCIVETFMHSLLTSSMFPKDIHIAYIVLQTIHTLLVDCGNHSCILYSILSDSFRVFRPIHS